jgi:hypothetical protein
MSKQTTETKPGQKDFIKREIQEAVPTKDLRGWIKSQSYNVSVVKLSNGKYAIYKNDFRAEDSGYKTYASLEEIKDDFILLNSKKEEAMV